MSRVGKLPVEIPQGVQVNLTEKEITIKGKLGELKAFLVDGVKVVFSDNQVHVSPANDTKESRALWGTYRNNIKNMVKGVSDGFEIRLELNGVGYRSSCDGKMISLVLGFSHEIRYALPNGISAKCEKPTLMVIAGADKQLVGQVAGELMKFRPAEPYKGKGIFIEGSYIRRKEGKKK
jgi:large subunit ribosomal protein L6